MNVWEKSKPNLMTIWYHSKKIYINFDDARGCKKDTLRAIKRLNFISLSENRIKWHEQQLINIFPVLFHSDPSFCCWGEQKKIDFSFSLKKGYETKSTRFSLEEHERNESLVCEIRRNLLLRNDDRKISLGFFFNIRDDFVCRNNLNQDNKSSVHWSMSISFFQLYSSWPNYQRKSPW